MSTGGFAIAPTSDGADRRRRCASTRRLPLHTGHKGVCASRPRATATMATVGCESAAASAVRRRTKAVDNSPAAAIISPVPGRGTIRGEAPAASDNTGGRLQG